MVQPAYERPGPSIADRLLARGSRDAADVLVTHLFTPEPHVIAALEYAADYRLAAGRSGGDIVDVFPLADGSVSFVAADISGKGTRASVQAALVKFSLRAFASAGMGPASALAALDRLYRETISFEESASFVTVFAGRIDAARREMTYASAGHEIGVLKLAGQTARELDVTGPAIAIVPDFEAHEQRVAIGSGTLVVLATDGITEARVGNEFFGMDGFIGAIERHADEELARFAECVLDEADVFSNRRLRDDAAVLAVRVR